PVGSLPSPPPRVLEPQIADELPDEANREEPHGYRAERGKRERRVPSRRPSTEVLPADADQHDEHRADQADEKADGDVAREYVAYMERHGSASFLVSRGPARLSTPRSRYLSARRAS